jgi:hypothetical protein
MDNGIYFYVCAGAWCFAPVIMLVVGIELGRGKIKIPWKIRIEPREDEEFSSEIK